MAKQLICRCGHKNEAHGLWNGVSMCYGYMYDSFCKCKRFAPDNLELLEELANAKEIRKPV